MVRRGSAVRVRDRAPFLSPRSIPVAPQQIRGSSSPTGISSTRRVPNGVRRATRPGCAAVTKPIRRASRPYSRLADGGDHCVRRLGRHDQHHLALVGQRQRVVAQQVADGAHGRRDGDRGLFDLDPQAGLLGELREHRREAAAGGVAQEAQGLFPAGLAGGRDGGLDEAPERRAVARARRR